MTKPGSNLKGISFLILAQLINSLQPVAVKWMGGNYPILEMVVLRNLVALPFTLLFFHYEGRRGSPTTQNFEAEFIRGIFLFLSYTTYMMGVLVLPLAQVEAIRFSGPIMITVLSVLLLSEKVNSVRWLALLAGFLGVVLIVSPGSATFNEGSLFILISVLFYALTVMSTRKLQATDSSATMAFYSTLMYLAAALVLVPITISVGEIPNAHASIAFLFHPWTMPTILDGIIMGGLGLVWAGWTYCMSRGYSLALAGAALTLLSGLFILFLDRNARQNPTEPVETIEPG